MKRIELLILVVIAASLAKLAFGPDEARAEAGGVSCEAFAVNAPAVRVTNDRKQQFGREWVAPVEAWLEAHPGSLAYQTNLFGGIIEVVCVRE
jgi:hypothetical protein